MCKTFVAFSMPIMYIDRGEGRVILAGFFARSLAALV